MVLRRMLLIVAILMGVTALTAGLAAPPRERQAPPPPTAQSGTAAEDPVRVERTLEDGGSARTIAVEEGDHVVLTVEADVTDTVELVGLDRVAVVAEGLPAVFDILADRPGAYPVELEAEDRRLGTLRVSPAQE